MTANKQSVRVAILREREALSAEIQAEKSRQAQQCLLASPAFKAANSVGLYMAMKDETATDILLACALAAGKRVWLPRIIDPAAKQMRLCQYDLSTPLNPGHWGILEPAPGPDPQELDLIIMPGVAFDHEGNRLGYGAGYYDRYLAAHAWLRPARVGLCFEFQIIERLPHERWDLPVSALCSENGLKWL